MRTLLDLGITPEDRQRVLRGLHEGKYNLLLGAGASYGCKGGDGVELKDGATLSQQIADRFSLNLNPDEAKKLPLTYEEAQSVDASGFRNWLQNRFSNCEPTWQKDIFQIHWERIWTFNIDDVLLNAFNESKDQNVYSDIKTFDWQQKIVPLEDTVGSQQVIYLHGRASELGRTSNCLVFSIPEYTHATRSFLPWHASFQTHYLERPFIVCGATLAEEVDISEAIRSKNLSRAGGTPSLIVSFSLDDGQKERMQRFNLVPIACPLDEFFSIALRELIEFRASEIAAAARLKIGTYERFLAQFRKLDTQDSSTLAIEGTDFYGGDEPTWNDILGDLDGSFNVTEKAASILDKPATRYAVLVHGDSFTGKSVSMLRIARLALRKGFKPFWFRHEEGLNAEIAADYLANDNSAVLFIDDAANFMESVGKILQLAKMSEKPARIFVSLRSPRLRGFRIDVADEFRHEFRLNPLHRGDLFHLVQRRRRASRLGKLVGNSDSNIVKELEQACKSELLEAISHIEFAEPIRQRVRKIVASALIAANARDVIARVVCVHRFGFSLPIRTALVSSGLQFQAFSSILDDHYKTSGILVRDPNGIRLRHRILSEYAWRESFTEDERYSAMSSIVLALAPLVNPAVIKAKGIEHLILREVLDQEQVSFSIGNRALEFYEEHEPAMGWSSRYWDQRALLESRNESHFSKAYSYSQKAISLEYHPYAFNSLGTICMTHAVRLATKSRMDAMKYFYEGEEALSTSWKLASDSRKINEHPFVKFFASASQMLRKLSPQDSEFQAVLQLFQIWIERAKDSSAFSTTYGQKRLQEVKGTYLKESLRSRRTE